MTEEPNFPKWGSEPYESYWRKMQEEPIYGISESQINNIIEVLEEWKKVLESFIENFVLLKQQENRK